MGKWDHTPLYEVSQVGPFDRWPSDEGFAHSYCFMAADVHQFIPVMWDDHHPEPYRKTEHLDKDLADRAIEWITGHKSLDKDLPFMMLWASGSMHSPHHAPDDYLNKYKGKFDMGWDKARELILANQKKLGIVPENTKLTERIDEIPAWDSLTRTRRNSTRARWRSSRRRWSTVDAQIGRVIDTLERIGELDNTLIFVTSDNGASGEGGLAGTFNETYVLNGLQTPFDANMRHLDDWGQAEHLSALPCGMGDGGQHAVPLLQAERAPRRPARCLGRPLAQRNQGQGRDPQSVPSHHRYRADHHGSRGHRDTGQLSRHPAATVRRVWP